MGENQLIPRLIRLIGIQGFEGRSNDIVYCRPINCTENSSVTVYFGGDVQDFTENMISHRDNKKYVKWNLENVACLLRTKFLDSHVIVVRPSRMQLKTFSCYQNFVACNEYGIPLHQPQFNSLSHLDMLINNIAKKIQALSDEEIKAAIEISNAALVKEGQSNGIEAVEQTHSRENVTRDVFNLSDCEVKIIGFSKGCVVLNQFLYEFHYNRNFPSDMNLITRIRDMYWIDGGHNGGKNTWISSKPLVETVSQLGINIHIHVSPYQIQDDRRPWIGKEEKSFYEALVKAGSTVQHTVHFRDLPPDINLHFELLNAFKK